MWITASSPLEEIENMWLEEKGELLECDKEYRAEIFQIKVGLHSEIMGLLNH